MSSKMSNFGSRFVCSPNRPSVQRVWCWSNKDSMLIIFNSNSFIYLSIIVAITMSAYLFSLYRISVSVKYTYYRQAFDEQWAHSWCLAGKFSFSSNASLFFISATNSYVVSTWKYTLAFDMHSITAWAVWISHGMHEIYLEQPIFYTSAMNGMKQK